MSKLKESDFSTVEREREITQVSGCMLFFCFNDNSLLMNIVVL